MTRDDRAEYLRGNPSVLADAVATVEYRLESMAVEQQELILQSSNRVDTRLSEIHAAQQATATRQWALLTAFVVMAFTALLDFVLRWIDRVDSGLQAPGAGLIHIAQLVSQAL